MVDHSDWIGSDRSMKLAGDNVADIKPGTFYRLQLVYMKYTNASDLKERIRIRIYYDAQINAS